VGPLILPRPSISERRLVTGAPEIGLFCLDDTRSLMDIYSGDDGATLGLPPTCRGWTYPIVLGAVNGPLWRLSAIMELDLKDTVKVYMNHSIQGLRTYFLGFSFSDARCPG
jgi:hypothetical protein